MKAKDIKNLLEEMGERVLEVQVVSSTQIQEATFVVANLKFNEGEGPVEFTIPFIVYPDGGVFMPSDWQGWLPETADGIDQIEWVSMPDKGRTVMINGLPRVFA